MLNSKMIGEKIAAARKKLNVSQAQLAGQLFISPQAVGKWERGESIPDIIVLNRLAKIVGVDLNYFSEDFPPAANEKPAAEPMAKPPADEPAGTAEKKLKWDMSRENLVDMDFSGLKNLHEKFSSSNLQRCLFVCSDLSGLLLKGNNVDSCDFSASDLSGSHFQGSHLANNLFNDCLLKETEFSGSYLMGCDFSGADFTGANFKSGGFQKNSIANAVWNRTSFNGMQLIDMVFEGTLDDCHFENCVFKKVTFQNATLRNTFFKGMNLKKTMFIDCKVDKLTYAFLKNGKADLSGVTLLPS